MGTLTTEIKVTDGVRTIKETFESPDLEVIWDVEKLEREFDLRTGESGEWEATEILTDNEFFGIAEADAEKEWSHGYDYPQWAYKKYCFGVYWYERADPMNIGLRWISVLGYFNWMLDEGYYDTWWCQEQRYVYDEIDKRWEAQAKGGAMHGDCWDDRFHFRIWDMGSGLHAISEHWERMTSTGHQVITYEDGESHNAVHASHNLCWKIKEDNYWLDNYLEDPYKDGYATIIYYDRWNC